MGVLVPFLIPTLPLVWTSVDQFFDFQMNLGVVFSNFKNLFGTSGCDSKHFFNIIEPIVMVNEMSFQMYQLSGSRFFNV